MSSFIPASVDSPAGENPPLPGRKIKALEMQETFPESTLAHLLESTNVPEHNRLPGPRGCRGAGPAPCLDPVIAEAWGRIPPPRSRERRSPGNISPSIT